MRFVALQMIERTVSQNLIAKTDAVVEGEAYDSGALSWKFIAACRAGEIHGYDIVEGPMADDTIWNYVNDFVAGIISRQAFWELAKFKHPTHQLSFHTLRAIDCLRYVRGDVV